MVEVLDFSAKPTVLVVDDTADNLAVISGLLRDFCKVKVASNGEKALQIVHSSPPDLILLDVMMRELSGYDVCIRLKENPATRDIPILFLTALAAPEDETRGLELGAEDYIRKPVNPSILRARVKTHLRIKGVIDFLRDRTAYLERKLVQRSTSELDFTESVRQIAREFKAATERFGK